MEKMMTMSATSTDSFDVFVDKGSTNYQISISAKSALTAAFLIGTAALPASFKNVDVDEADMHWMNIQAFYAVCPEEA